MLKIVTGENNEILRAKSQPVFEITADIKKLIKNMLKTLKKAKGLGIAAPQIGENLRIIIVKINHGSLTELIIPMINPDIIEFSDEQEIAEEGCLSLPEIYGNVKRAKEVKVKFKTFKGDPQILTLQNLNARVVQHEFDHLEGVLFIDRVIEEEEQLVF